jgi:hypothetical protein
MAQTSTSGSGGGAVHEATPTEIMMALLVQRPEVERVLGKRKLLDAFVSRMCDWSENDGGGSTTAAVRIDGLMAIVAEFGIVDVLVGPSPRPSRPGGAIRTRGAVRVRGAAVAGKSVELARLVDRVAAAYRRTV